MITSMHLTLDSASSCVGSPYFFGRSHCSSSWFSRVTYTSSKFELIDSRRQSCSRNIFHSSISFNLHGVVCALLLSFLIESVIVSSFASDLLMSSYFFDYYFRSGHRKYLPCSCSVFSSSALNDAPRFFYFFK